MKELVAATAALVLLVPLFPSTVAAPEEEIPFLASGERAKEYIAYLASDDLQGRQSCTEGYRKAADWVAANFAKWGLAPAGENGTYFQNVTVSEFTSYTGVPSLRVGDRAFLLDDGDFSLLSSSTVGTTVRAEAVFVGYGISAPDKELDEYAGVDVAGKVVVVLKGSPHAAPASEGWFSPPTEEETGPAARDPWTEEAKDATKIQTAYDKGAAGVLLYEPNPPEDDGMARYRRQRREASLEPERDFLCFTIEERVFRAVLRADAQESPSGLKTRVGNICRAIKAKSPQSAGTGIEVVLAGYETAVKFSEEDGTNVARNVLAKIEGTDPALKNQYVITGGHLDHVGMRDGYVRNGADDNASGAACTMEVARVLAEGGFKPKRTLIFCCWTGEEMGLYGSNHYAAEPCDGVSMDRTVAYFNADMVGLGDKIDAPGALNFPSIWEVIKKNQAPSVIGVVEPSTGGPGGSDHSAFIVKGIEAMALMTGGGGGHPYYHQPEDDADAIEPDILGKTAQFVVQGMMNLANETETNLLIENREQIYQAQQLRITNINPALEGSEWEVVEIKDQSRDKLHARIMKELFAALDSNPPPERPTKSVRRGIADLAVFEGDTALLELAADFLAFGRLDISGDDGAWIADGRLTDQGRTALTAIEAAGLAVHLVSPGEDLLSDFLNAAAKPFLVTGQYTLTESQIGRATEKGVVFGVDLDPGDLDDFLTRLEAMKEQLARRDLLVIRLTSTEGLDAIKAPLDLGLRAKGWAAKEISGSRRSPSGITGGNLRPLGPAPRTFRRR